MQKTFCDRCNEETEAYIKHEYIYKRNGSKSTEIDSRFKIRRILGELCPDCMLAVINDFGIEK